jgi:hypothetical protein
MSGENLSGEWLSGYGTTSYTKISTSSIIEKITKNEQEIKNDTKKIFIPYLPLDDLTNEFISSINSIVNASSYKGKVVVLEEFVIDQILKNHNNTKNLNKDLSLRTKY